MPEYRFFNTETEEYRDVFFKMNDDKVYNGEDGTEVGKWSRRWTKPNASIDSVSNTNPFDLKAYTEKTGKMKGNLGDLFAISKEASERREQKTGGPDPVKTQFFKDYQKKNNGAKHFSDRPDKIETKHAIIDFKATPKKFKES